MPTLSTLVSEAFHQRLEEGAELALSTSPLLRVFSHHDADGISAAAVMSQVLTRAGINFQLSILKGLERDFAEELDENGTYLFMDMGSSHLNILEKKHGVIVLDHHKPARDSEELVHVNTHILGVDGTNDASASTLAFLFGLALDPKNWDLAPIAMVGMIGDKQHFGGFSGVNELIVNAAVEKGFVEKKWDLSSAGKSIQDSLELSFDPYFPGLSGNHDGTAAFLEENGVPGSEAFPDLGEEESRRLASLIAVNMMEKGSDPTGIESIAGDSYREASSGRRLDVLVEYSNALGKEKKGGTGVAMLNGEDWAMEKAEEAYGSYRDSLLGLLGNVEKNGAEDHGSIQYLKNDIPQFNGPLAGISMQFILAQDKPTFSIAHKNGTAKVSTRGTRVLVDHGLDLSKVCHLAAEKCGGEGGGHPIASGASFPVEKEQEFLDMASEIVAEQLKE